MQPTRQLEVRTQGILAAIAALAVVAIVALVGLRFLSDSDSGKAGLTPTALAATTPLPVATTPATPPPVEASPSPVTPSGPPPLQARDKWGQVIESITEDPTAAMFRGSISRDGLYGGDAITKRPSIIWDTPLNDENYSAPVVKDGRIYVGGNDDTLKCFDAATGELVWSFKARDDISSSPAVGEGRVLFGSFDGNFYAVDAETGKRLWQFETAGAIHSSPAIDASIVYFGGYDHVVYAPLHARRHIGLGGADRRQGPVVTSGLRQSGRRRER